MGVGGLALALLPTDGAFSLCRGFPSCTRSIELARVLRRPHSTVVKNPDLGIQAWV